MNTLLSALRAAGEPTRIRLLGLLGHGELTVTELTQILGQSQPRVSRHLKLLMEAGLIERFSEGTWAFFRLNDSGEGGYLARTIIGLIPQDDKGHQLDLERLADIREARRQEAAEYFENIAEKWNEVRALYISDQTVEQKIVELVKGLDVHYLLDVGTGTGRMLELLAPFVQKGLGIDLSRDMLGVARTTLAEQHISNCQVRSGDMYNLSSPSDHHDLVLLHQVLHYADDPESVIREAARVLKDRGALVVIDFAPHKQEFLREEHAHRRLGFDDKEMARWAENSGMSEVDVHRLKGGKLTVNIWHFRKVRL